MHVLFSIINFFAATCTGATSNTPTSDPAGCLRANFVGPALDILTVLSLIGAGYLGLHKMTDTRGESTKGVIIESVLAAVAAVAFFQLLKLLIG